MRIDGDKTGCFRVPPPHEGQERWKSMTAIQLHERTYRDPEKRKTLLDEMQKRILDILQPLSNSKRGTTAWQIYLSKIVATAAELASTMAQQRCRIELFRSNVTSLREDDVSSLREMKSIADIGGSPLARPLFLVTPGLRKWGNGWGQNLEESTVLYPAQLATEAEDY